MSVAIAYQWSVEEQAAAKSCPLLRNDRIADTPCATPCWSRAMQRQPFLKHIQGEDGPPLLPDVPVSTFLDLVMEELLEVGDEVVMLLILRRSAKFGIKKTRAAYLHHPAFAMPKRSWLKRQCRSHLEAPDGKHHASKINHHAARFTI